MSGRRPQSTIDTCSSQSRYDQKIIHRTCIDVCISSVRLVPIILVIGFDRNFEMPRAEQPGKDTRGTRKLIVSSLAVARDRTAYSMIDLLFCSPHLCRLLDLAHTSPDHDDSHDHRLGAFAVRNGRKEGKARIIKRVRAPYLSSPLFCRRRFS
jgi:hypothetical protein